MTKNIVIVVLVLFCFKTITIAGESLKIYAPPSIWAQQTGEKLTGPVIDLVKKIFAELNISIKTEILPWARAIDNMKSGELDMIPVISHTEERSGFMAFTISYAEVPTAVFVLNGKAFSFSGLEDLRGLRGLMMRKDRISKEFELFESKLNITKVTNYKQILNMLENGRADYAVAAKYGFLIHAKKLGYADMIEALPHPIASHRLYFAFSRKSEFLKYLPIVNAKLKEFKKNGDIEKMIDDAINLASGN